MSNGIKNKVTLKDFLNPMSMLTPGGAGALTMTITNTLAAQFALPPNYTGLVISSLFALIVFFSAKQHHLHARLVCLLLNALIIFSIALGTNQAGVAVRKSVEFHPVSVPPMAMMIQMKAPFFANWLDGTVAKRTELLADVAKLEEVQAKAVARSVGLTLSQTESAKVTLSNAVISARTAESLARFEPAVKEATVKVMDSKPK